VQKSTIRSSALETFCVQFAGSNVEQRGPSAFTRYPSRRSGVQPPLIRHPPARQPVEQVMPRYRGRDETAECVQDRKAQLGRARPTTLERRWRASCRSPGIAARLPTELIAPIRSVGRTKWSRPRGRFAEAAALNSNSEQNCKPWCQPRLLVPLLSHHACLKSLVGAPGLEPGTR
jgi:hypothetical protein